MRKLWWIFSGIMLVIFAPVGIMIMTITIIKEVQDLLKKEKEENIVEQNTYFEDTLKEYK